MAKNPETSNINIFTDEQLEKHNAEVIDDFCQTHHVYADEELFEHNLNIAEAVHQATVISTARKMVKLNSGQQLQAMTDNCKNLRWSKEEVDKRVKNMLKDIDN